MNEVKPLVPTIPREVAEAIESIREEKHGSNAFIAGIAFEMDDNGGRWSERAETIRKFAEEYPDEFMLALVNGYTVEKSAEELAEEATHERIRTLFKEHGSFAQRWALAERSYHDCGKHIGYQRGMRDALRELNVKITEVNA